MTAVLPVLVLVLVLVLVFILFEDMSELNHGVRAVRVFPGKSFFFNRSSTKAVEPESRTGRPRGEFCCTLYVDKGERVEFEYSQTRVHDYWRNRRHQGC